MLALFTLLGVSSRAQAQSGGQSESGSLVARIDLQERQIAELKALVERQAQQLQSQQQAINELRRNEHAGLSADVLPPQLAAEDKRESAHLLVNRTHAPPQTINSLTEATSNSSQINPAAPSQADSPFDRTDSRVKQVAGVSALASGRDSVPASIAAERLLASRAQALDPSATHSPLQFRIGNAWVTPVGFMDFTSVWRNHDAGSGITTNFASIPYGTNTYQSNLSELRFSSQYSRIGFRVDALVKGARVTGYMESDFLGTSPGNLAVSTNSNTLRSRLYWADLDKGQWELLAGQTWSLITPNRTGISPLPSDIFYTQDIDADYQAGLVWARLPELRFVYHPSSKAAIAVALDSPEQYMGGSAGGGIITLPAALASVDNGGELDNGGSGLGAPNSAPDLILKLAVDPSPKFHFEAGGLERRFLLYDPITASHSSSTGAGGFANPNCEVGKGLRLLTNNFWSDGGGRYIFGQVPDLIVRSGGSPSPIHAGSTVSGLEFTHNRIQLHGYYGGIYAGRNVALDVDGKPIGYGYIGSPASHNRTIQELTFGSSQTLWKNPAYGALNLLGQYSYVARSPWSVKTGQPPNASLHMVFITLRYSLPGAAPALVK